MQLQIFVIAKSLCLFLAAVCWSQALLALPPPAHAELCKVQGVVISTSTDEGTDELMNRMKVRTVTIRISAVSRAGVQEASHLDCKRLESAQAYTFRNCDDYPFERGQNVEGIAGRSKGGGAYCIDHVKEKK